MDSKYDFRQYETEIYKMWERNNLFSPDNYDTKGKKPFCIMMPPPNANDPLHIGHAMFVTLEDIMIRYHRMLGDDTLWLPGTDHAGIETQFVFEKKLKKKGQSRFDFDRKTLYQMIWDYVQENSQVATNQMKKLGASADWSRFKFMLDPEITDIVLDTFEKLHEEGLIYRDLKLVNYCTRCGTSYSELEVNHEERHDPLYTIQYGPLKVATVRPETIFGDVALAVNPDDERYREYIGQTITADFPWGKVKLQVIADEYVKTDFGSGVLKITPYHDQNDWDVWQRHLDTLPHPIQVINNYGKLYNVPEKYDGLGVINARKAVVDDLKEAGLLTEKPSPHLVGTCYRCNRIIEPLPLPQFFIKVKPLVEPILEALESGEIKVHGAGYDKILKHWLENLRDWNISRQIVWGIRMPVWYKIAAGETSIPSDKNAPYKISKEKPQEEGNWTQETDTFDTWFSSAQWPFTTLQASKHEGDFERFYPTQVMETGYDILPFWVMRMLMIGKFATKNEKHPEGQLPFKDIYLHGLVRDAKGQKMSKSKGNTINPLEIIEKYGADALRMALVIRSSAGLDKSVGEGDFKAMRNFSNKIWNAARYILENEDSPEGEKNQVERTILEGINKGEKIKISQEEYFSQRLNLLVKNVTQQQNNFKLGLAAETLHNEFWHWFCDESIEENKKGRLQSKSLQEGLVIFLKLLHPFMPFVTEAIWEELKKNHKFTELTNKEKQLISSAWPK